MKQLLYGISLILVLLVFNNCKTPVSQNSDAEITKKIDSLLNVKSYFLAQSVYKENSHLLNEFQKLRLGAVLHNLFNDLETSRREINVLFDQYQDSLSNDQAKDLYNVQISNHVKLFEYAKVVESTEILLTQYKKVLSDKEAYDLKNNAIIWNAVSSFPEQKLYKENDSHIPLFSEIAGLKSFHIAYDTLKVPFIFDTGANLSVIIESVAKKMNMQIQDSSVEVNTITGQRIAAHIAVAPYFTIQNMRVENVVFLVFPDEALYIPQIDFQIQGILGYPVIEAMGEIHFLKNDHIYVPLTGTLNCEPNMAIEYLTPYINLFSEGTPLYFSFDTGADSTILYKKYYETFRDSITKNYDQTEVRFAGAAGAIEKEGYKISFTAAVDKMMVTIDSVTVLKESLSKSDDHVYGNIGQDFIQKFDKMILNFDTMCIYFE
ncbi:retropepsin-like aspartic protease [Ascidiimonas aurantiaca]|uniref:retropepsin-like aspartic protease n=1 Tax=Ascidiimonas aurantiaca TaxID=1685432 RepID=UPI0030EB9F81